MEVFPNFLVRVCGLEYDFLANLQIQNFERVYSDLKVQQLETNNLRQRLSDALLRNAKSLSEKSDRMRLINLRRDIFNGKISTIQELELHNRNCHPLLDNESCELLALFKDALTLLTTSLKEVDITYQKAYRQNKRVLLEGARSDVAQKGLILSSQTLRRELAKAGSPEALEPKIERAFAKYLSRICAKTSPFSTFTQVSIGSASDSKVPLIAEIQAKEKEKTHIILNTAILMHFQDILENDKTYNKFLNVRLNPTIEEDNESIKFLTSFNKIDSFQKIKKNNALLAVKAELSVKKTQTFGQLISALSLIFESSYEEVEVYVLELVRVGFLEFRLSTNGTDPNWSSNFEMELTQIQKSYSTDVFDEIINILSDLNKMISRYPSMNAEQRNEILNTSFKALSTYIKKNNQNRAKHLPSKDRAHFKKWSINGFWLRPENIIFEDVATNKSLTIDKSILDDAFNKINYLTEAVLDQYQPFFQQDLFNFFVKKYNRSDQVSFFTFYEDYFRHIALGTDEKNGSSQDSEVDNLDEMFIYEQTDEQTVHINPKNQEAGISFKRNKAGQSYSLVFHPYVDKGSNQMMFVINNNSLGYGKLFGRFLHLFDESIVQNLRTWNKRYEGDALNAENIDAGYFNANLHPQLLTFELSQPGHVPSGKFSKQIPVNDLYVCMNTDEESLSLKERKNNNIINPIDLGLEVSTGRTRLFQLLSRFSITQGFPIKFYNRFINQKFKKTVEKVEIFPRIIYVKNIILQRKTWMIDRTALPLRALNESDQDYFLKIYEWKSTLKLPSEVFVYSHPQSNIFDDDNRKQKRKIEDYKPQYISFESPISIKLFENMLNKVNATLKVVEMLPSGEDLCEFNGKRFVTEIFSQWYTMR